MPKGIYKRKLNMPHPWKLGNKNTLWKDNPGYRALHEWVNRHQEKTVECKLCFRMDKRIFWANISGEYKRNLDDWLELCSSCNLLSDRNGFWKTDIVKPFIRIKTNYIRR